MPRLRLIVLLASVLAALPALAQSGLKMPERGEPGLDPTFAKGWLAPEYDRFGFAAYQWRDVYGFASSRRMQWSYAIGQRANLSMSVANSGREADIDHRPMSLYGRYWFSPDWAVSAETTTGRDAGGVLRLQDIRIGVQRRF